MNPTCDKCKREMAWRTINFIADAKLWRVDIPLCIHPDCLENRGGTYVIHRHHKPVPQ